jgi:protoheme IX farnesyltransferase
MERLRSYAQLCRAPLSLFAACSAGAGFFLGPHDFPIHALLPMTAVFLLACGASALNQYQEQDIDARMERTKGRPLPSGRLRPRQALAASITLIAGGQCVLTFTGSITGAALGFFAVLWYNGIYTGLKRVTAFAAVPGAVVGMVPPTIGWVTAGGAVTDPRLFVISFVFFLWQVPHFWLQVLLYGEEYERAGLPSLTRLLTKRQIARVTFAWIVSVAIASLALPLYGSVRSSLISGSCILLALWLIWSERSLAKREAPFSPSSVLFRNINIYLFLLMSLLSVDNIFLHAL